jgi:hypothetical protein
MTLAMYRTQRSKFRAVTLIVISAQAVGTASLFKLRSHQKHAPHPSPPAKLGKMAIRAMLWPLDPCLVCITAACVPYVSLTSKRRCFTAACVLYVSLTSEKTEKREGSSI